MTLNELYNALDARIPRSLSCAWDNDGIMVLQNGQKEVRKVLCCLDCTNEAIQIAISQGFDLILCHHPLIFHPFSSLDGNDRSAEKLMRLVQSGIAVFSFHTRLDAVKGGVNDLLCGLLGLENVRSFDVDGIPMGRIGELPETLCGGALGSVVREKLCAPTAVLTTPCASVKTVALLGGSGGDLWKTVKECGADAYITGEAKYHEMLDAKEDGFLMIAAGHDYTEKQIAGVLARIVRETEPEIVTLSMDSDHFVFL